MNQDFQKWESAERVARDLFERETDVNEVQKLAAFARTHDQGRQTFDLVDALVKSGRYLVRTGRTMDYYHDLRDVCGTHLGEYRTATGEKAREMALVLAWAARLMRFYETDDGHDELEQRLRNTPPPAKAPPPPPEKPVVRVETRREWITLDGAVSGGKGSGKTENGVSIPCKDIPYFQPSSRLRADVVYEGDKPTRAVFKGWK